MAKYLKITGLLFIWLLSKVALYGKNWIVFYADEADISVKSYTGHAFVSFVREDDIIKQTLLVGSWGFYPKSGIGLWGEVEGKIRNDLDRQRDLGFTVEVSEEEFKRCLEKKREWELNKYSLTKNNCVHFLEDVAKQIPSLTLPPSNVIFPYFPSTYVLALKSLNDKANGSPCSNHPDIIDNYSRSEPNFHFYTHNYEICDLREYPCASAEFVFDIMASNSSFIAPYAGSQKIIDCGSIKLDVFGTIVTKVDKPLSITNYTKPDHMLHAGKVTRYVVAVGEKIYVYTVGIGVNSYSWQAYINQMSLSTNLIWDNVGEKLKNEVNRQLKEKKAKNECGLVDNTSLLLIDVSGSMSSNNKFTDAKQSAANTINTVKQEVQQSGKVTEMGIMAFSGGCIPNPTRLVQDFTTNLDQVLNSVNAIPAPNGGTPLPQAIERATQMLETRLNQNGTSCGSLIILGDGQSSCGAIRPPDSYVGPPVIKKICGQQAGGGAGITFFTVGFGIAPGSAAERDLQYLASTSGGKYFNAQDEYQLTRSLQKINRIYSPFYQPQTPSLDIKWRDLFLKANDFVSVTQQYDSALFLYQQYVDAFPDDSSGLYNLALMFEANERYKSAATYYEMYINLAPGAPDLQYLTEKIGTMKKDYELYLDYSKKVIQSDLLYLESHFNQLMNTPNAVPLAGEFAGFIKEKQPFYLLLDERLEVKEPWLKQYGKEISSAMKKAELFLSKNPKEWDMNGISLIGGIYMPMEKLVKKITP